MPTHSSKTKRASSGRPSELKNPRLMRANVEAADLDALKLLTGDVSAHVRAALKLYLKRPEIAARVREMRALIAEGEE